MDRTEHFETRDEAIRAALDALRPGETLYVHQKWCWKNKKFLGIPFGLCTCKPEVWEY